MTTDGMDAAKRPCRVRRTRPRFPSYPPEVWDTAEEMPAWAQVKAAQRAYRTADGMYELLRTRYHQGFGGDAVPEHEAACLQRIMRMVEHLREWATEVEQLWAYQARDDAARQLDVDPIALSR